MSNHATAKDLVEMGWEYLWQTGDRRQMYRGRLDAEIQGGEVISIHGPFGFIEGPMTLAKWRNSLKQYGQEL